eukprot:1705704-Amphidinium_carterae.1
MFYLAAEPAKVAEDSSKKPKRGAHRADLEDARHADEVSASATQALTDSFPLPVLCGVDFHHNQKRL